LFHLLLQLQDDRDLQNVVTFMDLWPSRVTPQKDFIATLDFPARGNSSNGCL
jgi:hypothetical protein